MLGVILLGKNIFIMAKQLIEVPCDYLVMVFLSMMSEQSW